MVRALAVAGLAAACVAAAGLAAGVARATAGAAGPARLVPDGQVKELRVPGRGRLPVARPGARSAAPATLDTGGRFSVAGLVCDVPSAGAVTVVLRTSLDGASWTRWLEAPLEVVDEPGKAAQAYIEAVWTGPARYIQVRARGVSGGPVALSGVRVVAIDPGADTVAAAGTTLSSGSDAAPASTLYAVAPAATPAATARASSSAPAIVTRALWGADESLRSGSPSYSPVKMAFIHHTASDNAYAQADAPGIVRAIYAYHTRSLHWSDIGYNFLVDRYGTIYEGRYGGISRGVIGAQVGGFNTGSTGVSVIGTFSDVAPPAAAVSAVERLLAWKLAVSGVDPLGKATLTCGLTDKYKLGQSVTFKAISGHRDANYTECPGDKLYALLPAVRTDVSARIGAVAGVRLSADQTLVSPNGDGVLDEVTFSATLTPASDWTLVLRDARGGAVATWSGTGDAADVTWDGTSGGAAVPDGEYTAELSSAAASYSDTATVTVDTSAPRLEQAGAAPETFSPNGDRQSETTAASYTPSEACSVRVGIQDADGEIVRWLHGWRARTTAAYAVSWDGRIKSGGSLVAAPDGQYRFDIERKDAAGNIARRGIKITLDRTIGYPAVAPADFSPDGNGRLDTTTVTFKLRRSATVTVSLSVAGAVVRTLSPGELAAGTRSVAWDGRDDAGAYLASSKVAVTVTAESPVGTSSVATRAVVDLYRPRLYAGGGRTTRAGAATRLSFKVVDPFSARADVRFLIKDSKGRRVASGHPGKLATGKAQRVTWRPRKRGRFTVIWRATDLAGNRELKTARTLVTVR